MPDYVGGVAGNATSRANLVISANPNWNAATQVSMHFRVWIQRVNAGGTLFASGASWNGNMGGVTGSGGFSYSMGNTATLTLWEFDWTYNKDGNGYINIGCSANVNMNNPGWLTTGSASGTYSPTRIGVAPTMNNPVASNVSVVTATISGTNANNGNGTSTTVYLRYKKTAESDSTYTQQQTTSWDLTGLTPGTSYTFQIYGVNNNGDYSDWVNTQTFTTLPAPSTSAALLGIIGVL